PPCLPFADLPTQPGADGRQPRGPVVLHALLPEADDGRATARRPRAGDRAADEVRRPAAGFPSAAVAGHEVRLGVSRCVRPAAAAGRFLRVGTDSGTEPRPGAPAHARFLAARG